MNLANMKKLRTRMRSRKNPVEFNMDKWFAHGQKNYSSSPKELLETVKTHACGTVACLAGHAAIMYLEENDVVFPKELDPYGNWIYKLGRHYLGLPEHEANSLFYGQWWNHYNKKPLRELPKAEAIRELTRLIEGEEARRTKFKRRVRRSKEQ